MSTVYYLSLVIEYFSQIIFHLIYSHSLWIDLKLGQLKTIKNSVIIMNRNLLQQEPIGERFSEMLYPE